MARTQAVLSACMIVQQLNETHFKDWDDTELDYIRNGDNAGIINTLGKKLCAAGFFTQEMHCIIHDNDVREVWDESVSDYIVEQKPAHFHCLIKFMKTDDGILHGGTISQIATAVGLEPEYVEKPKRGKYAYDNMLAYLIHAKDSDKAQYSPDEVLTSGISDENGKPMFQTYKEYYRTRKKTWEEGRAKKTSERARIDIDSLEAKILRGEVFKNQILLTDEYYDVYARNKRRCDDAFDSYAQRKIAKTIQRMENGEFKLAVIYVTGESDAGKSMFTDNLVKSIQKKAKESTGETWTCCSTAATNPFDEYMGDEILIMDDLRGMALTASDWLKLLDPDRANIGSARYKNKKIACRTIIINASQDPLTFFYYVKGSVGNESMDQFIRRIMASVIVYRIPDTGERRAEVGITKRVDKYEVGRPINDDSVRCHHYAGSDLELNYDFETTDMNYEDGIEYLSDCVMKKNNIN